MISVIVPIYNVSQYLPKCMDSILAQTWQDMEIILVDDGSTDDCPQLCDEYASQDDRIRVIHKPNGGLSDARNVGMREASGEWIYFIDSDDWMLPEALQQLYEYATKNQCEVVQGNLYYAYKDHLLYRQPNKKESKQHVFDREEAMRLLIVNDRVKNFAWGKLYRADILQGLDFPVGKYFEDSYWQHLVMHRIQRYGIIDEPLYYYRQREDSISGTASHRLKDLEEGYRVRLSFIQEYYPQFAPLMQKMCKKVHDQVYPKRDLLADIKSIFQRIWNRLLPSKTYKSICLK